MRAQILRDTCAWGGSPMRMLRESLLSARLTARAWPGNGCGFRWWESASQRSLIGGSQVTPHLAGSRASLRIRPQLFDDFFPLFVFGVGELVEIIGRAAHGDRAFA